MNKDVRNSLNRMQRLIKDLETTVEEVESAEFPELFVKAFNVPGDQGDEYIVSKVQRTMWECTCPDYRFRRRECKHIMRQKHTLGLSDSISDVRGLPKVRVSR